MKISLPILQTVLWLAAAVSAGAQTFKLDKPSYKAGESITATWTAGPGNSTDWVGIYKDGQTPGSSGVYSTLWFYVNGTQAATEGLTEGSVTFQDITLAPGPWVAHFLASDGYDAITDPIPFTVEGIILSSFTTDAAVINAGGTATLSWVIDPNGQPTPTATITGGPEPVDVTNTDTLEVTPSVTTTYTLTVAGATPRTVTVNVLGGNSPAFTLSQTALTADTPLTVTWSGGPGNPTDWIGIYRAGDTPGPVASTRWWYTNGTRTAGDGLISGSVTFPPDLPPGDYFAAFLLNDGYTMGFGPVAFTVSPATFAVSGFGLLETGEISLTWYSDPAASVLFNVQESTDLKTWTDVDTASAIAPASGSATTSAVFTPAQGVTGSRYYRIVSIGQ